MRITVEQWKELEGRKGRPPAKKRPAVRPAARPKKKMAKVETIRDWRGDVLVGVTMVLPYRLVTLENQREDWRAKARRASEQRNGVANALLATTGRPFAADRFHVVLTRLAPRTLDRQGNLEGSFKHVQDGVADWLGIDDGSERIEWEYRQEKVGVHGVRIRIEARP